MASYNRRSNPGMVLAPSVVPVLVMTTTEYFLVGRLNTMVS